MELASISARRGLEPPQILVEWVWPTYTPDIIKIQLVRSTWRYPTSTSDGDLLLDETPTGNDALRTTYVDTSVEADTTYYYSLIVQYRGPFSLPLNESLEVSRLGEPLSVGRKVTSGSEVADEYVILARSNDTDYVIWEYSVKRRLVTDKITISFLNDNEIPVSVLTNDETPSTSKSYRMATSQRYLYITIVDTATEITASDITATIEFSTKMSAGFSIAGAVFENAPFPLPDYLWFLDKTNLEIKKISVVGAVTQTVDLSGTLIDDPFGLSRDDTNSLILVGNDKNVYAFDDTDTAPDNSDIEVVLPTRLKINCDFSIANTDTDLLFIDKGTHYVYSYDMSTAYDGSYLQIEESPVPGGTAGVEALWYLDDESGNALDHSGNSYDGVPSGASYEANSKFHAGMEFEQVADNIDLSAAAAAFSGDTGYISFWWKSSYTGYTATADRYLVYIYTDANNYFYVYFDATDGNVKAELNRGGTSSTVTISSYAAIDDTLYHHIAVWWEVAAGNIYAYLDAVSAANAANAGAWVGAPATMLLGGNSNDSMLGVYSDVVLGTFTPTVYTRYTLTTDPNRSYATSGRDPDSMEFNFRNKLFTYMGEYVQRNDYGVTQLHPETALLTTGEVLFREDKEDLALGHLGALSRLVGLLLDCGVDERRYFLNHLTASIAEDEYIRDLGQLINANDIDSAWNVDAKRKFLEIAYYCYKTGGTVGSFVKMVRYLGFADIHEDGFALYAPDDVISYFARRRTFDSGISFDSDTFDSSSLLVAIIDMYMSLFLLEGRSTGTTSIPATRQLTDATATFNSTAEVGSMIEIYDPSSSGDNGQYLITNVNSNTLITVDKNWPTGSLAGIAYSLYWHIPTDDPYTTFIIDRLKDFKARWQSLIAS